MIPNHIAYVPNGHRRGSKKNGLTLAWNYIQGANRALAVAGWAKKAGVKHVTFFGLSCENLQRRPEDQIDALMHGAIKFLDRAGKIGRVHAFGHIDEFEGVKKYEPLYDRLKRVNGDSYESGVENFTIHVAANYSGRAEHELRPFIRALYSRGFPEVERDTTRMRYLLSAGVPEVDLFVRTGGEHRLSGLLPFQSAYAELYFVDTLWTDFSHREFQDSLRWYARQPRNFGK